MNKKLEPIDIQLPEDTPPERLVKLKAICDTLNDTFLKYDVDLLDFGCVICSLIGSVLGSRAYDYFKMLADATLEYEEGEEDADC